MKRHVFHDNDHDGVLAAAIFLSYRGNLTCHYRYHTGDPIPNIEFKSDDEVYFLDCSPKADDMLDLAQKVHSVTVMDHHNAVFAELEASSLPQPNVHLIFDEHRAACEIVAGFLTETQGHTMYPRTSLINNVAIHDLGLHQGTSETDVRIHTYAKSIVSFLDAEVMWRKPEERVEAMRHVFAHWDESKERRAAEVGSYLHKEALRRDKALFDEKAVHGFAKLWEAGWQGDSVDAVVVPQLGLNKEVVSLEREVLIMYAQYKDGVVLSFRSGGIYDGMALKLAQFLGGNGHPNAAAAKVQYADMCFIGKGNFAFYRFSSNTPDSKKMLDFTAWQNTSI